MLQSSHSSILQRRIICHVPSWPGIHTDTHALALSMATSSPKNGQQGRHHARPYVQNVEKCKSAKVHAKFKMLYINTSKKLDVALRERKR
jgi:hypothetical protein